MQRHTESQRSLLREATNRYVAALAGSPGEEYLATRGLTAPTIREEVAQLRLGYVADPLPGHEPYAGAIAIPYLRWSTEFGWMVVSMKFRCIRDHDCKQIKYHGKYATTKGDTPWLYNTNALMVPSPFVVLAEGEVDAITSQVCGLPTVGVPGVQTWQPYFRELFLGYRDVIIPHDGDDAGYQFAETVSAQLPNTRVIAMPDGEDINSFVLSHGKAQFFERIGI